MVRVLVQLFSVMIFAAGCFAQDQQPYRDLARIAPNGTILLPSTELLTVVQNGVTKTPASNLGTLPPQFGTKAALQAAPTTVASTVVLSGYMSSGDITPTYYAAS